MDVVLSLTADASDRAVDGLEFELPEAPGDLSADPVMKSLYDQLGRTEREGRENGVYADAIRLALVARWLRLRSRVPERPAEGLQKWRLARVLTHIGKHLHETITLAELARTAGLSRMYFAKQFRAATGFSPHDYIRRRRIERAKGLLLQTEETLVEVALEVGFQTQAHFTTVFKKFVGMTPGRWRAANCQSLQPGMRLAGHVSTTDVSWRPSSKPIL